MKVKKLKILGLTLILSLLCSLSFVLLPNKNIQASAADEIKYNHYMLVSGNPTVTELSQPAGSLIINGQIVEGDSSYTFTLGQKDIVVSAIANQGFVLKGWYILYEENSFSNFIPGTTNGYVAIANEEQFINNGLLKIGTFDVADKQASIHIVEMFDDIKIAPVYDYQYFNVSLKGVNNSVKDIGLFKYGDNVVINETVDSSFNIDALEVVSTNEDIDIDYSFTTHTNFGNTTAYSANFVMSTYEDVVLELVYDNLYQVDLKFVLADEEVTDFESQEFEDLFSCLTIKNDIIVDEETGENVVVERYFKKLNTQGTSYFVKQNKNFEISVLNNFKNPNGFIYYNFVSLDNSTSNLTANYNNIAADKVIEIKYAHNIFSVEFVGVVLNDDNTVQVNEGLNLPSNINNLTRVNPEVSLTDSLLQTNVGYNFEGFAKFVPGKTQYTATDMSIDRVSLDVDAPQNLTVYLIYSKVAYTINLTRLTSVSLTNSTLATPQIVYPIASAKVGAETKSGTNITFGTFYIDDTISLELTLNKGFILNSVSDMTKADETKEIYTLLLDAEYLSDKGTTIDLPINAELEKYSLTYRIDKYEASAMADISVNGFNVTETLVGNYYQIVIDDLTYYQTVTLESKANGTGTEGEYYLFKWFTTDFKSTITTGLDNDENTPPKYFIPYTIYGDSVVYVVYAQPRTQLEIRVNSAPASAGLTFVVNQIDNPNEISNIGGLYALDQQKQVTVTINGLNENPNLFGYKFVNTELYTTADGISLSKISGSESTSTTSYLFTPTTSDIYVLMINIQKIEYTFNITSNTAFTMSKVLTIEDTLIEFDKPVGYYVGKVMIEKNDGSGYEEYSNMNQNNSSRNGQIVGDKNLFEVFTYTISTEGENSEFEQIIEKYGKGTTSVVVNIQLTFNIYQYEVNLKYYKFNNNAVDNTTGVKIVYPTVALTYSLSGGQSVPAEYENLPSEVKFKYIPYGADVNLRVVRGVSAGFEMKGWYDYNATYKLAFSGSLTEEEKLLQFSLSSLQTDYKLSYRVDYIKYTIKLNYTEGEGSPLVNEGSQAVVKMGEKFEIALNARIDKGFMGYSVNYIQPVYTKYEFTTAEQFSNDYKSLVIIKNGYIYPVLSNVYDKDVEYFSVSSENVENVLTTYTDYSFDIGNYVAEGNVINFVLDYIPVEMKIKNVSQTIAKLDASGNVMYEALNLEKAGLTADQIATYTITAENGGVTRPIVENTDLITVDDIITIDIAINEVQSSNGNTYKLYKGLELYTYALTNGWDLSCVSTGEGRYRISFAVANNIRVEFAQNGIIEINYGYQQKALRTVTATSNLASSSSFISATELSIVVDNQPATSDNVGTISKVGNFLSAVKVSLDLESLKDHFVINSITAYAGSSVSASNKITDLDDYYISPKTSGLLISHVELTMFDADIIIQFNVQPRLYLEGIEITTQPERLITRTYAIDNDGNGIAQTFTLGSDLSNDIAGYGINSSTMQVDVYKNGVLQTNGAINASEEEYVLKLSLKNKNNTDSWLYYIGELPCVIKLKINKLTIKLQYEITSQFQEKYSASSEYDKKFVKVGNNLQSEDGNIILKGVANKNIFNLGLLTFDSQISANIVSYNDKGELINQKNVTSNYVGIFVTGLKLQNANNFNLQLDEYVYNSERCNGLLVESCVQIVPKVVNILNLDVYDKVWDNTADAKFGLVEGASSFDLEYTYPELDDISILKDEIKVYFTSRPITQYELQTRNIDDIIREIKCSDIAEGKYVIVDARTALAGAQKSNYIVGDFRVGVVNYKDTKTIYPYTLSTTIKGVGNVTITNKRGLTDHTKANLIPVKATLSIERIEPDSAGYREIQGDISSYLSRRNVFAAGYKIAIVDRNGAESAVNNELYLTLPSETELNNVVSLSSGKTVKVDYSKEGGNIVIDLSQIDEEISYIVMIQNRALLQAWQIVLIVVLSVVAVAGIGVTVFFIVRKRKKNLEKYDVI